jgi:hypothetical protein
VIEIRDGKKSLYFVGTQYQSWFRGIVTIQDHRHEFDEVPPKVMKVFKSLHIDGLYSKSISSRDCVLAAKAGYQQLLRAFHAVATHGDDGNKQVRSEHKEGIAILVAMLFEGPTLCCCVQLHLYMTETNA